MRRAVPIINTDVEDDVRSDRIMTPEHTLWPTFLSQLSRVSICQGTTKHARAVLEEMPGIEVDASLEALAELGGTCDCAIELDVASMNSQVGA